MSNINDNPITSDSQNRQIFAYLKEGNRITSMDALYLFNCFRLASRISDLRRMHPEADIKKVTISTASGKRVAQYYML